MKLENSVKGVVSGLGELLHTCWGFLLFSANQAMGACAQGHNPRLGCFRGFTRGPKLGCWTWEPLASLTFLFLECTMLVPPCWFHVLCLLPESTSPHVFATLASFHHWGSSLNISCLTTYLKCLHLFLISFLLVSPKALFIPFIAFMACDKDLDLSFV